MFVGSAVIKKEQINKREKCRELLSFDLDFSNRNNNHPIHNWHAFPAKFPPQIPYLFIDNLTTENDSVLDPMMGSCTTLLEAARLNRHAIGFDIDPLSILIGRAKFNRLNKNKIVEISNSITYKASLDIIYNKDELEKELKFRFDEETLKFLDYWFLRETQIELLSLYKEIEKISDAKYQLFFKLIFSSIIITKSGGVTLSYDLAHTRPHKVFSKKVSSPLIELPKKVLKISNKIIQEEINTEKIIIEEGDVKNLPIDDNSIDLIITSPPYANNAIDYIRAHKFSLIWFGYSISDLKDIRRKLIGAENIKSASFLDLPAHTKKIIYKLKNENEKKGLILQKYYSEMKLALRELHRVLKPESPAIIVVASSVLSGVDVETHKCIAEMGEEIGFELIKIGSRNLDRNRRMMPVSFNSNNSKIEARMHVEYLIGFYKSKIL